MSLPAGRRTAVALIAVLLLAAGLRLPGLTTVPPGLHQDEAANAWNAWCLLHTGADEHGKPWPVTHLRAFGGQRSTLAVYLLVPSLALGGLDVAATRIPFAAAGVLAVLVVFLAGRRLGGEHVGLAAAALLALNPWHLMQSRWAHEASLVPLLVALPLWLWLRAGLPGTPFLPGNPPAPCARRALLAGLVTGVCLYGYPAVRPFFLVFLVLLAVFTVREWLGGRRATPAGEPDGWGAGAGHPGDRRRRVARAGAMFLGGLALVAAPLAWAHLTDPDINRRLADTTLWRPDRGWTENLAAVAGRYPPHFGPSFLFLDGDRYELQSPPGAGQFHLYAAPLMLLGLFVLARRRDPAVAFLAAGLLAYPAGDLVTGHTDFDGVTSMHALRSLPGLPGFVLLGGFGLVAAARWLGRRPPVTRYGVAALFLLTVLGSEARFLDAYLRGWAERRATFHAFHVDLVDACRELRADPHPPDALFITASQMVQPYVVSLVARGYPAQRWFAGPREVDRTGEWDEVRRYGNTHFLFGLRGGRRVADLRADDRSDTVEFWLRTPRSDLPPPRRTVPYPDGRPALVLIRTVL